VREINAGRTLTPGACRLLVEVIEWERDPGWVAAAGIALPVAGEVLCPPLAGRALGLGGFR
jgi:hypothetical protein